MPSPLFLGVNYAAGGSWRREQHFSGTDGWDFGIPPLGWEVPDRPVGVPRTVIRPWEVNLELDLRDMWHNGISAIRWFILGGGKSFGTGHGNPQLRADYRGRMNIDTLSGFGCTASWDFSMPGEAIYAAIESDFIKMLRIVRASHTNIRIVPVIIDYRFLVAEDAQTSLGLALGEILRPPLLAPMATEPMIERFNTALRSQSAISGLRWSVIENPQMRTAFIENVVSRLARATVSHCLQDRILWWDIGNELDIVWSRGDIIGSNHVQYQPYSPSHPVFLYVSEAVRAIHAILPNARCPVPPSTSAPSSSLPVPPPFANKTTVGWLRATTLNHVDPAGNRSDTGESVLQYHGYAHANGEDMTDNRCGYQPVLTGDSQQIRDYLGDRPFWWHVPNLSRRQHPRRPIIIGELATSATLGRRGIDCVDPRGAELWIGLYAEYIDHATDTAIRDGVLYLRTRNGRYFRYSKQQDTLAARLNSLKSLGYSWVFLWEWNRSEYVSIEGFRGDPLRLPSDPYSIIATEYSNQSGSERRLTGGFVHELRQVNYTRSMIDVEYQTDYWSFLRTLRGF